MVFVVLAIGRRLFMLVWARTLCVFISMSAYEAAAAAFPLLKAGTPCALIEADRNAPASAKLSAFAC